PISGSVEMVQTLFPDYPIKENLPILPTSAEVQRHRDAEQEQAQQQAGGTVAGTGSDQQHTSAAAHARAVPFGTSSPWAAQEEAGTTPALPSIEAALAALHAVPHPLGAGEGIGSNSWVVSGEHTASGQPILANTPHLAPSAPGIWYQQGLHCRDVGPHCPFDVGGLGCVGMPVSVIPHNGHLSWRLSNLGSDASDSFLGRVYQDDTYLYGCQRR